MKSIRNISMIAATIVVVGAGCDLGAGVKLRNPFEFGGALDAEKPYALTVGAGATVAVRPSALGIGGTVSQLLGNDVGAKTVAVKSLDANHLEIAWKSVASATGTPMSGTVTSSNWATSHAMLPPVFWKSGDATVDANGLLWLSPSAYAELAASGSTDWRVAEAGPQLPAFAAKAFATFESVALKLAQQTSATATSAFRITKAAEGATYPLRVNGNIEHVETIRAESWFAQFLILKNADTPLVLNVTVKPAALVALKALEPLGANAEQFGYEVTEVTTK